jgi:hypothetical protein
MGFSRSSDGFWLRVGILLLTLATALIHIFLAFSAIPYYGLNFGVMLFILNGLGYLGLLAVLQLPIPRLVRFRSAVRWVLVAYTALTIVLWVIMAPVYDFIGYTDKAIEIVLIALLLAEARTTASEPSGVASGTRTMRP